MMNILQTFEPNTKGRDFVIGDLHGAYPLLEKLLENLNFDFENDRMFSVGDLIDRGPYSLKCLGLLRKPWLHSALANHEQLMYEAFHGGWMGKYWWNNGGSWGLSGYTAYREMQNYKAGNQETLPLVTDEDADLIDLQKLVRELPFLITVNHKSGKKFHILHAELPATGGLITDSDLSSPQKVYDLATRQSADGGDAFLWSRAKFIHFNSISLTNKDKLVRTAKAKKLWSGFNDNLSHIISGHTPVQRPVTLFGQTNIDTKAYDCYSKNSAGYSDGSKFAALTCIDLDTWTFYQATPTEFRTVEPLVINKADLDNLESQT